MTLLDGFTQQFTQEAVPNIQLGTTYYYPSNPPTTKARLAYTSVRLGVRKGEVFRPAAPLLDMILPFTDRKAVVNDKSAWLFLCGKNVLKEGIVSLSHDEGLVLVLNERGEVLGYGRVQGAGITNRLDRGEYLRMER
jgi:ribosome biogenesis protein Nip4